MYTHNNIYLMFTRTFDCKDIGIRNSEFGFRSNLTRTGFIEFIINIISIKNSKVISKDNRHSILYTSILLHIMIIIFFVNGHNIFYIMAIIFLI